MSQLLIVNHEKCNTKTTAVCITNEIKYDAAEISLVLPSIAEISLEQQG